MAFEKPRRHRDTTLPDIDRAAPAYRIVHGIFGGPSNFSRATGIGISTCHQWLYSGFIPAQRMAHIRAVTEREGIDFDPLLLIPDAKLDPKPSRATKVYGMKIRDA